VFVPAQSKSFASSPYLKALRKKIMIQMEPGRMSMTFTVPTRFLSAVVHELPP
jgi:hypothetical protein